MTARLGAVRTMASNAFRRIRWFRSFKSSRKTSSKLVEGWAERMSVTAARVDSAQWNSLASTPIASRGDASAMASSRCAFALEQNASTTQTGSNPGKGNCLQRRHHRRSVAGHFFRHTMRCNLRCDGSDSGINCAINGHRLGIRSRPTSQDLKTGARRTLTKRLTLATHNRLLVADRQKRSIHARFSIQSEGGAEKSEFAADSACR